MNQELIPIFNPIIEFINKIIANFGNKNDISELYNAIIRLDTIIALKCQKNNIPLNNVDDLTEYLVLLINLLKQKIGKSLFITKINMCHKYIADIDLMPNTLVNTCVINRVKQFKNRLNSREDYNSFDTMSANEMELQRWYTIHHIVNHY